ncbi:thiamine-phosphate kinase [Thermoplasma acidophilum]|uniref:thiamine-phosphate kinase n=1 Tax=Thermoplasma acidophilum TaxID=2303 RepID=UPI00064EE154|nr:thiamine-phosphate kinase [Thermoplasma acidophilum]MCY0852378.1 thiamine-phosphate kinase [Thermoplasma acidophilum]
MKLKYIGERSIISKLASITGLPYKDDCSWVDEGDHYLLITTDSIRKETHLPDGTDPHLAGRFMASINLSDIAAMAGHPISFMTAYSVSPDLDMEYLEAIEEGMMSVLRKYSVDFIGGDLKEGDDLTLVGIAIGRQTKKLTRKRSDIAKGQMVGYTNRIGRAASGYIFYKSGYDRKRGLSMLLGVEPRISEAIKMSEYGARFMMDLSDGLYASLDQMKQDYGVGFRIVRDEIAYDDSVNKASEISGSDVYDIAGNYGGDYEILFSVDEANYKDFQAAMDSEHIEVHFIGETWNGDNIMFDGNAWHPIIGRGYEHFSEKPKLGRIV